MADTPISSDATLVAGAIATGDLVPLVDISEPAAADKNKNTTFAHLVTYFNTSLSFAAVGHTHDTYDYAAAALTGATVFSDINVVNGIVTGEVTTREFAHADLASIVANEHIDWTNATQNLTTTGYLSTAGITESSGEVRVTAPLYLTERAAAGADTATLGQIWVKNTSPQELYFTDDDSADHRLGGLLFPAVYNNQTGTSYTILESDNGKILTFNNASSIAVGFPDTLSVDFQCTIVQIGAGVVTVTPSGSDTVNGAGTGVSPSAQWKGLYLSQYSATNWLALL